MIRKPYKLKKGVMYFDSMNTAEVVLNNLRVNGYAEARIVQYELGYAIQREISGPYWGYPKKFGVPAFG